MSKKTRHTKEELIDLLKIYINKYGLPKSRRNSFVYKNGLPAYKTYAHHFGDDLVKIIELTGYKLTDLEKYDINTRGSQIYYTKEEVIEKILQMKLKLNRPLMYDDFRNPDIESVGIQSIKKYFGTMNKMKKELGLEVIQESMIDRIKSKDEMLKELKDYINELGRVPTSRDLNKNPNIAKESTYYNYFGGLNNALILIGHKPNKVFPAKDFSNEDIIKMYKDFIEDLGFVPSHDFCKQIDNLINPVTILRRLKCKWNEFIEMLGYKPNEQIISCEITYARDGAMCLSSAERYIHDWFLDNKDIILLDKEGCYRHFLNNLELQKESGYMRYDWLISINNKSYVVEYFGMIGFRDYKRRHDLKLSLIDRDNKNDSFISLYQKDLNKLDSIFKEVV